MTNTQRLAVVVTVVNLVLLVILLGHDRAVVAQSESVLRGRSLELVDAAGQVRAEFIVEPDGDALFRSAIQQELFASSLALATVDPACC